VATPRHARPRARCCCCCCRSKTTAAATSSALRRRARPWEGAHRHRRLPLAIFCDQVFFDYDPSSSTSLLSSAMGQTKAKNRNGNGGDWSETVAMLGGEPKNTVGLVTRQPHFSINSNLTLKVTALSNWRFLGGPRFLKISFWGLIFLKSSKVGLLGEISCEVRFLSGQIPARDKDRPTSDLDRVMA